MTLYRLHNLLTGSLNTYLQKTLELVLKERRSAKSPIRKDLCGGSGRREMEKGSMHMRTCSEGLKSA